MKNYKEMCNDLQDACFDIAERKRIASMERHREGRYTPTKEEWAATMREHRKYKHQLHKEGKI